MQTRKFTKEELKEALNQFIDLVYEKEHELNLTHKAVSRLIDKTPAYQLTGQKAPTPTPVSEPTTLLDTKKLLMSRAGGKGYEIDLETLQEMFDEFVDLRTYEGHKDPSKDIGIMTQILNYNKDNVTGYGRVTEGQVYGLERVGETLDLEPLMYLTDAE